MARMRRKDVLAAIRVAGYHGDQELGMLFYVKNWISLSVYRREFAAGAAMRESGLPCDCSLCSRAHPLAQPSAGERPHFPRSLECNQLAQMPPGLLFRR